ncbi:MAG: hypothetical protein KDK59_06890, partial [Simkania sp.]|nr:hypothetical protein [Simkania sp.]
MKLNDVSFINDVFKFLQQKKLVHKELHMYFGVEIFAFIATGLAAGILAGLLGLGGGVVTIPCLILVFHFLKIPHDLVMHLAIG